MSKIVERFIRYAKIDTQSDETSDSSPSTSRQLDLSRLLYEQCKELALEDVSLSEHGIVMATLPANVSHDSPTIAWLAHVDTSPEYTASQVNPVVHENYAGGDIVLPGDFTKVISVAQNPALNDLIGETIITTDGTTLLGADDKSGITAIMTAVEHLLEHPEIEHGPIRICFTVDEEIGRGIENLDLNALNACCGYTLDSEGRGRIDSETFSADLAVIHVHGVNTHPSEAKGKMVNAIRVLSALIDRLPKGTLSPETTTGREGFMHPYHFEGGVSEATARIILRDFETDLLHAQAALLNLHAGTLRAEYPDVEIQVNITKQYRNMREGLDKEPRALAKAIEATKAAGMEPKLDIIRGGTDGSLLTEAGLPTPNLSSGQHNPHSPLEWTSEKEMQDAANVLVELARLWGRETM